MKTQVCEPELTEIEITQALVRSVRGKAPRPQLRGRVLLRAAVQKIFLYMGVPMQRAVVQATLPRMVYPSVSRVVLNTAVYWQHRQGNTVSIMQLS